MYDVMTYWETAHTLPDQSAIEQDYARIWKGADKVVYSRTLATVSSERTRIERDFDPGTVRQLKESADSDVSVGGPELAAEALRAGLVDEVQLFLNPVVVGGGTRALPDNVRMQLELLDEHRFGNGVVYLRYGVRRAAETA
jgi:dihydrofolate reductase